MRGRNAVLAAELILMAPLGATAADLVVWWEKCEAAHRRRSSGIQNHADQERYDPPHHSAAIHGSLRFDTGRGPTCSPLA
jgi:hypothetical protein